MVLLELVAGRKGRYDVVVLVTAYGEALSFHELLFILKHYFDSEHSYYPVSEGFLGKGMLLSAITCVAVGVPLETVLSKFKLNRKGKRLNVVDKWGSRAHKRVDASKARVLTPKSKLTEVLE